MESITRRRAIGGIAALSAGALSMRAAPLPRQAVATGGPRRLPKIHLTTHTEQKVRFYEDLIQDRIVVINFMYVKCEGVCPGMTMNLVKLQRALGARAGRDVFMYSISLKPHEDSPADLKQYAAAHEVGPGWLFLTGSAADTERLRRTLGFTDPDPVLDKDISNHIGLVLTGNDRIDRWAACPALAGPDQIMKLVNWMGPVTRGAGPAGAP
jgi:protein SCO1/2